MLTNMHAAELAWFQQEVKRCGIFPMLYCNSVASCCSLSATILYISIHITVFKGDHMQEVDILWRGVHMSRQQWDNVSLSRAIRECYLDWLSTVQVEIVVASTPRRYEAQQYVSCKFSSSRNSLINNRVTKLLQVYRYLRSTEEDCAVQPQQWEQLQYC